MARIFQYGFDRADADADVRPLSRWRQAPADGDVEVTDQASHTYLGMGRAWRAGSGYYPNSAVSGHLTLPSQARVSEFYLRAMVKGLNQGASESTCSSVLLRDDNGDDLLQVHLGSGQVYLLGADTGVEMGSITSYTRLEIYYKIHDTQGAVRIRYNGVEKYVYTTGDTKAGGTTLGHVYITSASQNYRTIYLDDLAINDTVDDGRGNDTWVGPGKIVVASPSAIGTHTDWDPYPGTGEDNYEDVDDASMDAAATYVSSDISGQKDCYHHEDLLSSAWKIRQGCVAWNAYARLAVAGSGQIAPIARRGAIESQGDDESPGTSWTFFQQILPTEPSGAEWTPALFNDTQFGYIDQGS